MKGTSIILAILLIAVPVCADSFSEDYNNSEEEVDCSEPFFQEFADQCGTDTNTENGHEAGGGVDVVIWQNEKEVPFVEEFVAEYRYDANSHNQKVYGVFRFNLWNVIKRLFGK